MKTIDCVPCAGTGQIEDTALFDMTRHYVRCGACGGNGKLYDLEDGAQGLEPVAASVIAENQCRTYLMDVAHKVQTASYGTDYSVEDLKRLLETGESVEDWKAQRLCEYFGVPMPMSNDDIELTTRALKACGYRVHIKERAGTRWVTAVKGLDVQYKHWHPLTNINQAMQLLIDAPGAELTVQVSEAGVAVSNGYLDEIIAHNTPTECGSLINAQCRAIVTACASLEPVR